MNDKSELLKSLRIDRSEDEAEAPGGMKPIVAIGLAAACLLVGGGAGWLLKPSSQPAPAAQTETAASAGAPGTVAPIRAGGLTASGYVVARVRATIAAEVTGRVVEVRVEEGQEVKKGQVLAVLDATIAAADAQTAQSRALSAESNVRAAEADNAEAQRNLDRSRSLAKTGFVSEANLKTAQARADSAAANLAASRSQLNSAKSEANRSRVQLSKFEIRAPFTGVVIDKAAQPGEIISPLSAGGSGSFTRTGICTIVDMSSLEIEVDVNEAYIGRVKPGQKVEAVLDAYPDVTMPAKVIATIPTASRDKATVRVRIGFDQIDPRTLPDMAIKVNFVDGES
jgi:RND family efflux transporter MFP subunit